MPSIFFLFLFFLPHTLFRDLLYSFPEGVLMRELRAFLKK
jgi:hypothetical protein